MFNADDGLKIDKSSNGMLMISALLVAARRWIENNISLFIGGDFAQLRSLFRRFL